MAPRLPHIGLLALFSALAGICLAGICLTGCGGSDDPFPSRGEEPSFVSAKADDANSRTYEVLMNAPHCDVCTAADKNWLGANSPIKRRVIELIDGATGTVDAAQFTFSVKEIEAALRAAHDRGVGVRLVLDSAQEKRDGPGNRLKDHGVPVRFVAGRPASGGGYPGIQHAKFLVVDGRTLATGSNNWSSTGTSFNEESTIVAHAAHDDDELLTGFRCHFDAMWNDNPDGAMDCSNGAAYFTPGSAARKMIRDELRAAQTSVDILMHHFTFKSLAKEVRNAAERGVKVRLVVNAADEDEHRTGEFALLEAAGGEIRFKRSNADLYQLCHHKTAIIDRTKVLNGSGNWSGSGFFQNYENYVRYTSPTVSGAFNEAFERIWDQSLSRESVAMGRGLREEHYASTRQVHGSLHAHAAVHDGDHKLDDGKLEREGDDGELIAVSANGDPLRFAFEYGRDVGGMDFMALSPHSSDDEAAADAPNMTQSGYEELLDTAAAVTAESGGDFVAIPSMEWSTNSTGNHVNVFGSSQIARISRGRYDLLYDDFLAQLAGQGERPLLQYNHPKTYPIDPSNLKGNWDQIFGVELTAIESSSARGKKFNDYGLDDYPPLNQVRDRWISGLEQPDRDVVLETLQRVWQAAAPYGRLMEVLLNRGNEFKHEAGQNPSMVAGDVEGTLVRRTKVHSDFDVYLRAGWRLAPVANHDNHYANWGTAHSSRTVITTPALTEQALLDALDKRAVFASEDQHLMVHLYAEDRVFMGGELRTITDTVRLQLRLADPDFAGPYDVRLYRGTVGSTLPQEVMWQTGMGETTWHDLEVTLPGAGQHFIYAEILEPEPDRMAWTAPIWVEVLGECGDGYCSSAEDCTWCDDCGTCPSSDDYGTDFGGCGDGLCSGDEDCHGCSSDCGACDSCGDGSCSAGEDCEACPSDCGACTFCGDGECTGEEGCATCSEDCGACVTCGDSTCDDAESCEDCPEDCGPCTSCGDGTCDSNEDCETCPSECGACQVCGDSTCDPGEDCASCPSDCGACAVCGDDACAASESCSSCPDDCGTCVVCGDGACTDSESCSTCEADCGICAGICCDDQNALGCSAVPAVEACVCDQDAYCCDTAWDWVCANEVTQFGCGSCE